MTESEAEELMIKIMLGENHYEDDYFAGEHLTFGFDNLKQEFYIQRIDTIVGSYNRIEYYYERAFLEELKKL